LITFSTGAERFNTSSAERRAVMFEHFLVRRRIPPGALAVSLGFALGAALAPCALEAQALTVVSTSVSPDGREAQVATNVGLGAPAHHPSRVLVRFRNAAQTDFLPGSQPAGIFQGDPNLYLVENPPGLSVAAAVRRYRANPGVLYAEPDFVVRTLATPTDPLWSQQWDMTKISCPQAWDTQ